MKVQLPEGPTCYLSETDSLISQSILHTGSWEWVQGAVLRNVLEPTDTFLDIGAHLGYFTLLAAPLCKRVVAVDAQEPMLDLLRQSIAENGFTNVECVKGVVGFGKGTLYLSLTTPNTGAAYVGSHYGETDIHWPTAEVGGILLSEALLDGADVIKVDIEGAEGHLFDSEPWLMERARAIFFEYSPALLARYGEEHLLTTFRENGYTVYHGNGDRADDLTLPNPNAYWNLIALKGDK